MTSSWSPGQQGLAHYLLSLYRAHDDFDDESRQAYAASPLCARAPHARLPHL